MVAVPAPATSSLFPQLPLLNLSDKLSMNNASSRDFNQNPKVDIITPPSTPPDLVQWTQVAELKQGTREKNLSKYQSWRLDEIPREDVLDVSEIVLSKLTQRERGIVHMDATAITASIRERKYTAVEVLIAFCKVTVAAQDTTNCITEIFFEEGLARARELDEHLQKTGEVVGPLHGLPVSIKDHILVKGQDTSTGYITWANGTRAEKDAVVVDILRKAGAVLYVKTANPQTLLCLETNNNIFGRTVNPFNRNLSPGGSSGGEGALIAAHGSPMGVGTDIGGSIRVPAAWSGLYGFKPSVARMPHAGLMGSHDGMDNIVGVVGPLATSARDLELFCRTMLQYEAWILEHAVLEIPWRAEVVEGKTLPKRLSFAILWDDGVVKPHPPLVREMQRVKQALLAAGHEVIDWQPLEHQEGWDLIVRLLIDSVIQKKIILRLIGALATKQVKLYLLDGGQEYRDTLKLSGEPAVPGTEWILNHAAGRPPYTVPETWKLNLEREGFRARALAHWNSTVSRTSTGRPVDGIICPTAANLAIPHDQTRWWGYSSHWNLLDLPGVVFPSGGRLNPAEFQPVERVEPRNALEKEMWDLWNPETFKGAPINLQLIGRRHNEEKVLAMLNVVEKAMKA